MTTQFTGYIDLAQVVLYGFWVFFAALIFYLRREDKREGYPLLYEGNARLGGIGYPPTHPPKDYVLRNGHVSTVPNHKNDRPDVALAATSPFPGSPYVPTGNPMLDGVGPGSYANREDEPELTMDDVPAIVPMRVDSTLSIESRDPDPRGMKVFGADGAVGGTVSEVWIDRAEMVLRYLEVDVAGTGRKVLLPITMCRINREAGNVKVVSILGRQFADVPGLANPNQVTKLEEDKICGYYGGGYLYATAERQEPLI